MATMAQNGSVRSIYSEAVACLELFDSHLKSRQASEACEVAKELHGRFILWTTYVGAFAAPKASLDARLADHDDVRDMILELLIMVKRNLLYDLRSTAKAETEAAPSEPPDGDLPLLLGLDAVESALSRLHSLAVAIRRSATQSHRQRVASAVLVPGLEELWFKVVRRRFKDASASLIDQVGKSIHARGRSMQYQQSHNHKIAQSGRGFETSQTEALEARQMTTADGQAVELTTSPGPSPVAPTETNASVMDKQNFLRLMTAPKPARSHLSRGSTVRETHDEKFGYPRKPRPAEGSSSALCPLCSEPLDVSIMTDEKWQNHVDRDLEPYFCISEDCRESSPFFATSREWRDHMQRMHTLDWAWSVHTTAWRCDLDHAQGLDAASDQQEPLFHDRDGLMQHLSKAHGESLSKPQILARARRGRIRWTREPFTCPFCDSQPEEIVAILAERPYDLLSAHIGRHLKAMAFMSLSYLDSIEYSSVDSGSDRQSSVADDAAESFRGESFDGIPTTLTRNTKAYVEDHVDDVIWSFSDTEDQEDHLDNPVIAKAFSGPDLTLGEFAAALKRNMPDGYEKAEEDGLVEDVGHSELPELPDCPRRKGVSGKTDWITLPRCDKFHICPTCYTAAFAGSPFLEEFIRMPRPSVEHIACDFGTSPWYRIAWLLIMKKNQPDIKLFYQIYDIDNSQSCPGGRESLQVWNSIRGPRQQSTLDDFTVCLKCCEMVETLFPSLTGIFTPLREQEDMTLSRCSMHFHETRRRFVLYFDAFEVASDEALATNTAPDVTRLAQAIERLSITAECSEDRPLRDKVWYSMPDLPEFTVCDDCFEEVIKPELEKGTRERYLAHKFDREPQRRDNATCQLYSKRMVEVFAKACRQSDAAYLKSKVLERLEVRDRIRSKVAELRETMMEHRERVNGEIRNLVPADIDELGRVTCEQTARTEADELRKLSEATEQAEQTEREIEAVLSEWQKWE